MSLQKNLVITESIEKFSRITDAVKINNIPPIITENSQQKIIQIYPAHPKQCGVEQTKKFLAKNRSSEWDQAQVQDHNFLIHPKVFHAGRFPSTSWFAAELCNLMKPYSTFCEVGCGSGVISCLVALANPSLKVTATDINPCASENTKMNAKRLHLDSRVTVYTGDVLDSIEVDAHFDAIFWALPFGFLDPSQSITIEEAQVFDPGYRSIRKLLCTAKNHLVPGGKLFLGFSSDLGHFDLLLAITREICADIKIIARKDIQEDIKVQFEILELSYNG